MKKQPSPDDSARRAAVSTLAALATSDNYRDRADAGIALVLMLDVSEAKPIVLALVLDRTDTFVTRETSAALARRGDPAAWSILAAALTAADDNSADWIDTGIDDGVGVFSSDRNRAVAVCRKLLDNDDPQVGAGAAQIIDLLSSREG